jgi:hypothetical protein
VAGLGSMGNLCFGTPSDFGMENSFQLPALSVIGKNQRSQPFAIKPSIRGKNLFAKCRDDLCQPPAARLDSLAGNLIGINHHGTLVLEESGDAAFAGSNASGQPDNTDTFWPHSSSFTFMNIRSSYAAIADASILPEHQAN